MGLEILNNALEQNQRGLKEFLKRFLAYFDSEGKLTIGIGSRTHSVFDIAGNKRSASFEEVESDFDLNTQEAIAGARRVIPTFDSLSLNRQMALSNMVFQMGAVGVGGGIVNGKKVKGFERMLAALAKIPPDFDKAADEILDSEFVRQMAKTGNPRAKDMAELMRKG